MKHVFRFIGIVVVLVVLAALVLYFLNGQGYLKGPLSEWINRMQGHIDDAVHDTQDAINEYRSDNAAPSDTWSPSTPIPDAADPVQPTETPLS